MENLISRDALLEEYEWLKKNTGAYNHAELDEHIERIKKAPAIDAVEVVRCRDCIHRTRSLFYHPELVYCTHQETHRMHDYYCAHGKKEEK